MNTAELEELFAQVAAHLTGRACKVRLWQPVTDRARGQIYKDPSGRAVIDISPTQNLDEMFETFCHEVGHLMHDFDKIPANNLHRRPEGSLDTKILKPSQRSPRTWEDRADKTAAELVAYARKNCYNQSWRDEPSIALCLRALLAKPK